MVASANIKTPSLNIPFKEGVSQKVDYQGGSTSKGRLSMYQLFLFRVTTTEDLLTAISEFDLFI